MSSDLLNLYALHLFVRVAECRYIKVVAKEEGLTPSAVSQALSRLEKDIGVPLFIHDARPLKLSIMGQSLLHEAPKLLASARGLKLRLSRRNLSELSLRLGISESVAATISPWLIGELSQKIGTLSTTNLLTKPLTEALRSEKIDVAVLPDGLLQEDRWHRVAVYSEDFLLIYRNSVERKKVLTNSHKGKTEAFNNLSRLLSDAPFVGYAHDGSSDALFVERVLRSLDLNPEKRLEVSSSYTLIGLVSELGGWSIVPPTNIWCGRQFMAQCAFTALTPARASRTMWVVTDEMRYQEDPRLFTHVAETVRRVFNYSMYNELDKISKFLSKHCKIIE